MKSRSPRRRKKKPAVSRASAKDDPRERLQKVLARAGVGSRRACEELIQEGRVEVDGKVVTELGTRVDALQQKICVDGELKTRSQQTYYIVNKPIGVVSTNRDPAGRMRVIDLIPSDLRLFPVGRLDRTSEGLMLLTNDGQLANRLTHPRYQVAKTYLVRVVGRISFAEVNKLMQGVHLAEGFARPESVGIKRHHRQATDLEIVLREGRNREIRRLLARAGHKVINLRRTAIGSLKLGSLPMGSYRKLRPPEVQRLEKLYSQQEAEGDSVVKRSSPRQRTTKTSRKKSHQRRSTTGSTKGKVSSKAGRKSQQESQPKKGRQRGRKSVKRSRKGSSR